MKMEKIFVHSSDFSVSFEEVDGEKHQVNFFASLNSTLDNDKQINVGYVRGTVARLWEDIGPIDRTNAIFALEVGENPYAYQALSPLYSKKGHLNMKLMEKLRDEFDYTDKIIYLDEVSINPEIASLNIGSILVFATVKLIYKIIGEDIPVLAILGSHVDPKRGDAVRRYFKRYGFKPVKPKDPDSISHYLPLETIRKHKGLDSSSNVFYKKKQRKKKVSPIVPSLV